MSPCDEFNKAFVAKKLQLLTNLVANKTVFRVFPLKFTGKSIYLIKTKNILGNALQTFQYVHKPSSTFHLSCT